MFALLGVGSAQLVTLLNQRQAAGYQYRWTEGLGQIVVGSEPESLHLFFDAADSCEQDEGDVEEIVVGADFFQ